MNPFILAAILIQPQPLPPAGSANNKFHWDISATLPDAQSYTYKYYADGGNTGIPFTNVICVATPDPIVQDCAALIPAFTPGNHSVEITASNEAGESDKSVPFLFRFVVTPAKPAGIRIGG